MKKYIFTSAGVWIQGLAHARSVLYHWVTAQTLMSVNFYDNGFLDMTHKEPK
jgi:hypothetical protein